MYHGEVSVQEEELPALLKIAEALKVKGLVEAEDNFAAMTSARRAGGGTGGRTVGLGGGGAKSGGGAGKVWPVSTSKLLSPKVRGEEEEPGTLVIDEEHGEMAPVEVDYDFGSEDTPPAPGMVKTIGPNGKVEWKRYKQYTKDDILAAIEEVKNGEFNKNILFVLTRFLSPGMSALQASRKYGVPSRTLYDKVKKMGILTANMQKQLQQKGKGAGPDTPQKGADPGTLLPISLLGMQLPQAGLPALPPLQPVPVTQADTKTNGDTHPPPSFTSKETPTHTIRDNNYPCCRSVHAVHDREDQGCPGQAAAGRGPPQPERDAGHRTQRTRRGAQRP